MYYFFLEPNELKKTPEAEDDACGYDYHRKNERGGHFCSCVKPNSEKESEDTEEHSFDRPLIFHGAVRVFFARFFVFKHKARYAQCQNNCRYNKVDNIIFS